MALEEDAIQMEDEFRKQRVIRSVNAKPGMAEKSVLFKSSPCDEKA